MPVLRNVLRTSPCPLWASHPLFHTKRRNPDFSICLPSPYSCYWMFLFGVLDSVLRAFCSERRRIWYGVPNGRTVWELKPIHRYIHTIVRILCPLHHLHHAAPPLLWIPAQTSRSIRRWNNLQRYCLRGTGPRGNTENPQCHKAATIYFTILLY